MAEITWTFIAIVVLICVSIPLSFHIYRFWEQGRKRKTINKLCDFLFPGEDGRVVRSNVIAQMMELTNNRFTEDEMLDYYLKIKGLQMVDLNSFYDSDMRKYLMKPTLVRLQYRELVTFYERFLNQTEIHGLNAGEMI